MKNLESKNLRVHDEIGTAFIAVADLLGIDKNTLLEELMASYIKSIRLNVAHPAAKHPQYTSKYPYMQ